MGQLEVLKLLSQEPDKWFTVKEVSDRLELRHTPVSQSLRQLKKYDEVDFMMGKNNRILYKYPSRTVKHILDQLYDQGQITYKAKDLIMETFERKYK